MRRTTPAVFFLLFFLTSRIKSLAQQHANSSVFVKAVRQTDSTGQVHQYTMHIINLSVDSIICITHSYNIFLIDGFLSPENILVPVTPNNDSNKYVLYYGAGDTLTTVEGYFDKLASILLPFQRLQVDFGITEFTQSNFLMLEYITLPDICYKAFKKETVNSSNWLKNYTPQYIKVELE